MVKHTAENKGCLKYAIKHNFNRVLLCGLFISVDCNAKF